MPFNASRCKVQLKLGLNRLKLLQQKKSGMNAQQKREIANLLEKGKAKEESARIRVEHIIREDFNIEALEILELYCELLLARFGLIEEGVHCDVAIAEAVNTVIFAAHRSGVKELVDVRDQLCLKYGTEFGKAAMIPNELVNTRIVQKLKVQTPDPKLVDNYLLAIADWKPSATAKDQEEIKKGIPASLEGSIFGQAPASVQPTGFPSGILPSHAKRPAEDNLPLPSLQTTPFPDASVTAKVDNMSDFDELHKRFEALKKRK